MTIGICIASLVYWGWTNNVVSVPTPVQAVFSHARDASDYSPSRAVFPFADQSPNVSAVVFVVLGVFTAAPLLLNSRRHLGLGLAVVVFAALAAVSTESRTGLIGIGVAVLAVALLSAGTRQRLRIAVSGAVVIALILPLSSAVLPDDRHLSLQTGTFQSRQEIWDQALTAFNASPWVGHGFNYSAGERFIESASPGGAPERRLHQFTTNTWAKSLMVASSVRSAL